ncbi:hypothetical protein JCM11491_005644 [Sporobolomyces phaffii]
MADPAAPANKVFSIFAPRPKPRVAGPASSSASLGRSPPTSHPASTAPEPRSNGSTRAETRPAARDAATEADCITLGSSDDADDDPPRPSPSSSSMSHARTTQQATKDKKKNATRGRPKPKAIVVDSDSDSDRDKQPSRTRDDEDIIVVKGSTPKKKKKKHQHDKESRKGKKNKVESIIDLTTGSPSPRKASTSSSSFVPLSDLYRHDRERRRALQEGLEPRWPTAEEHGGTSLELARASLAAAGAPRPRFPRSTASDKGKARQVDHDATDSFLSEYYSALATAPIPAPAPTSLESLPVASTSSLAPRDYPSHPLLDRLASALEPSSSPHPHPSSNDASELWTTKYGPRNAREVLGDVSGQSAVVLREWLQELKVAGSNADRDDYASTRKRKRPILRGVDKKKLAKKKKRRTDGLDDFLASSSSESEDGGSGSGHTGLRLGLNDPLPDDDDFDEIDGDDDDDPGTLNKGTRATASTLFHRLTNLILLVGPTGSGKTVSVHAVAQELGYEVFEVNAGMGKRRAKDIESEVGDVGRNHIVSAASPRKKSHGKATAGGGPAKDFFAGFRTAAQPTTTSKAGATSTTTTKGKGGKGNGPTQSLILIEEVDVLFVGEEDFWFGIRQLAQESRRPVILTCTDSSSIPFDQLGLQKIHLPSASAFSDPLVSLPFSPPAPTLVVPYLELIALSEGHVVEPRLVRRLYARSTVQDDDGDDDVESWLCHRNGKEQGLPHPIRATRDEEVGREGDLRKTITQLQFELSRRQRTGEGLVVGALRDENVEDVGTAAGDQGEGDELERIVRATDSISFADAHVSRRIDTRLEDLETGAFLTASDALLSPSAIPLSPFVSSRTTRHQLASVGIEPALVATITSLARASAPSPPVTFAPSLQAAQLTYVSAVVSLSDAFFYSATTDSYLATTPFLPSNPPTLIVDHLPLWRHVTQIDDERARIAKEYHDARGRDGTTGGGGGGDLGIVQESGRGIGGVRRSTRVGASASASGGDGKVKIKIKRQIEWRDDAELEFVRNSGFPDH